MSHVTRAAIISGLLLALFADTAPAQSWISTTPLTFGRDIATAQTIGTKIYVTGGRNSPVLQAIDTRTDTWETLAPMSIDRCLEASGVISGKLYVAGGLSYGAVALSSAEVYDPGDGTWTPIAPLPVTLACMASAVADGKLYVFSGASLDGSVDEPRPFVYVYDPATNFWTRLDDMPRPRKNAAAVELGGLIYVVGGLTQGYGVGGLVPWVDVYDPTTDTWTQAPDLPIPLVDHALTVCHGRIWTLGGLNEWPNVLSSVYSFRPGSDHWREELPLPEPLLLAGAATAPNSVIYTFGGGRDEAHGFAVTDAVYKRAVNEPDIVSIRDVPNDEGGRVSIRWMASVLDVAPGNPIDAYWIWRQVPTGTAMQALADRTSAADARGMLTASDGRLFRLTSTSSRIYYWEYVGSQVAHGFPAYSFTAPTLFDSIPGSDPYTLFMVEAEQLDEGTYWASVPDSGHSIDNLAPDAVGGLAATYQGEAATLHWLPSASADVGSYNIYRNADPWFTPSPETFVASTADTSYADTHGLDFCFKISAVDIHGNESESALLLSARYADVPNPGTGVLALSAPRPNPATTSVAVRFALSRESAAALEVFDASGRLARTLASGVLPAGEHSAPFDLTDHAGRRLGAGLYFVRLRAEGQVLTQRLCVIK